MNHHQMIAKRGKVATAQRFLRPAQTPKQAKRRGFIVAAARREKIEFSFVTKRIVGCGRFWRKNFAHAEMILRKLRPMRRGCTRVMRIGACSATANSDVSVSKISL
jgi:hypothetical protein